MIQEARPSRDAPSLVESWLEPIVFGLTLTAIAVAGQITLARMGVTSPLLLIYPAVALAAWRRGPRAAVTVILAGTLGLLYFVLSPVGSFAISAQRDALELLLFGAISSMLVYFIDRARRALTEAVDAHAAATIASASKESMIAVVAHDLRNPMQTISLNAELLATRANLDRRMQEALDRLRRSVQRACHLVDNIIESAHADRELFPLDRKSCAVWALVEDAMSPFEPLAAARSIAFERPRSKIADGAVVCDHERILQVLTSLLSNAFQFTPNGGKIRVDVERRPEGVRIAVIDNGRGMTSDELTHAFERLWHGPAPGHGMGLGLWIGKTLLEAHGSRLSATTELGSGTEMSFVLPADPAAIEAHPTLVGAPGTLVV